MKQLKMKKRKKGGFLPMILGILVSNLLGSALTRKGVIRSGKKVIRPGEDF